MSLSVARRVSTKCYANLPGGIPVTSAITREDFADEKFLKPVLEDDALLISLDELPEILPIKQNNPEVSANLVARVSELEEELRRIQSQFEDYRTTVKQTLDERWAEKGAGSSSELAKEEKRDDDSHYFSSYSYNGDCFRKSLAPLLANICSRYPRDHA